MSDAAPSVALVGAGKMGGALLAGWTANSAIIDAARSCIIDPGLSDEMKSLAESAGVAVNPKSQDIFPDVAVLAVKPQILDEVLSGLSLGGEPFYLSIAAGKSTGGIAARLGGRATVIRAMPNTPAAIGEGVTALFASDRASSKQRDVAERLMAAVGKTVWVNSEAQMDAVTAVSGSGPAYVFYLAECLAAAAVDAGLPTPLAEELARATVAGAGALMTASDISAEELRRNVTSKGGTTEAALKVLMAPDGLKPLLSRAVSAAKARSRELND